MRRLLDIKEDTVRDLNLHYEGSILYDEKEDYHLQLLGFDGNKQEVIIFYRDSKKVEHRIKRSIDYINTNIKAVNVPDGFVNLNGYCLSLSRKIDKRYKKCTTVSNTTVTPLGRAYIRVNNKRTKSQVDAYTILKAAKDRYYSFPEAMNAMKDMFSCAMTRDLALVKQPVLEGECPIHVVYHNVYVGEVKNDTIVFAEHDLRELLIDSLREVGYEA